MKSLRDVVQIIKFYRLMRFYKKIGIKVYLVQTDAGDYCLSSLKEGKTILGGKEFTNPRVVL